MFILGYRLDYAAFLNLRMVLMFINYDPGSLNWIGLSIFQKLIKLMAKEFFEDLPKRRVLKQGILGLKW